MADGSSALAWEAEQVEIELRRAYPNELEKGELADSTGLTTDELRTGLETLRLLGRVEEGATGFVWRDVDSAGSALSAERSTPASRPDNAPEAVANAASLPAPGAGPSYRAVYTLAVAFAGARGEQRDEDARRTARTLQKEFADVIADNLNVGVAVELTGLHAFDSPRDVALGQEEEQDGSNGSREPTVAASPDDSEQGPAQPDSDQEGD